MIAGISRAVKIVRNFLLSFVNREFLIFLFFLALSGIFWLMMTLNETYEKEITIEVKLLNVPRNVVITSETTDTIHFTVRDKGYMVGTYLFGKKLRPIYINFNSYADGNGHGVVAVSELQKQIYQQLYYSSKIVSFKTDKIEFFYNFGRHKKVPVRLLGRVNPGSNSFLAHVQFKPDSVVVYASKQLLDSIREAFTTRQNIHDFTDEKTLTVRLNPIKGAKFIPQQVEMHLFADVLTEETVQVPIEVLNMPADKTLRTFPSKVPIRFVMGVKQLKRMPKSPDKKELMPNGFRVVVDYNEILQNPSENCRVHLRAVPNGVRDARLELNEVDYLIESR